MSRPAYHVSYSLFLHAFCNITTYAGVIGSPDTLILLRSAQCLLLTLKDTHGLTAFSDILADRHRSPPYNVSIQTMRNAYGSAATSHVCSLRIPAIATAPLECMLCPAFHATQAPSRSLYANRRRPWPVLSLFPCVRLLHGRKTAEANARVSTAARGVRIECAKAPES